MSKPEMNVALVCGPDCDMSANGLRTALEFFGARVFTYWIGRPSDLIDVLSGDDLYPETDFIILEFHGDEGRFLMPELDESVYEEGEPRVDFGPEEIARFTKLNGKVVLGNGCSLGNAILAKAFIENGCSAYIGPDDYPDGNAALMFALRFFYEMIQNKRSVKEAFAIAKSTDKETHMYQLYERSTDIERMEVLQDHHLPMLKTWFNDKEIQDRMAGMLPLESWYNNVCSNDQYFIWAGYAKDELVGIIIVEIEEEIGYIALIVNPSLQNRGYGKELLRQVLIHPELKSVKKWEAEIEEDHLASIACFRALGFIEEDAVPDEDGFVNFVYDSSKQ
ncbi:L-amino acid N-acyltransferase YncA [Bacillus chungangensis]|uniref:L-amino acid N-acyltransferase YncA n=3 Tax=Bacillus chungangensis TaxID=587633 RepID=A0ABT9WXL5_9BACI|nr:L-amino acid N-acyltransferase YncA [Bacillus chungangensis]